MKKTTILHPEIKKRILKKALSFHKKNNQNSKNPFSNL